VTVSVLALVATCQLLFCWCGRCLTAVHWADVKTRTVRLDEAAYRATFRPPMRDVTEDAEPAVDVWTYVHAIPMPELGDIRYRDGEVEHVYRSDDGQFDHVLVPTFTANVYVAVIVSRLESSIRGHHILDLNRLYQPEASPESQQICDMHNAVPDPPASDSTVGIALGTLDRVPLNGLRHPSEGKACGWFIWGGPDLSDDPDFFQPVHVAHLPDHCPAVLPYLAMPPGWKFLIGEDDHVDVWHDEELLRV